MSTEDKESEELKIFRACERHLNSHHRRRPQRVLLELGQATGSEENADFYGSGKMIEDFEKEIASLLGKEEAVFMPSGTMAQPIALRIWCDEKNSPQFGLHPTSHLENHEHHAYRHLHNLRGVLLGEKNRVLSADDLLRAPEGLAAVIIELPHRELGGVLPSWDELRKMSDWCRERNIRFHLDGARLWESAPFYQKSHREISELFDSVYVSFYKGLGGIAGAVLAGPKSFIGEAKIWQRRQGGNLVSLFPYVLAARKGLSHRLPRMESYHRKALDIAEHLREIPEIEVVPPRPQTNMMHLLINANLDGLEKAFLNIAARKKVALFRKAERLENGLGKFELHVGDATMELPSAEIAALLREAVAMARAE